MRSQSVRTELVNRLRKEILSGMYGSEGGLPGPLALTQQSGLSRGTVNTVLAMLEGEGLIVHRDDGYYVNSIQIVMTQYCPPSNIRYIDGYSVNIETQTMSPVPEHLLAMVPDMKSASGFYRVQVAGENLNGLQHPLQYSHRYYVLPLTSEQHAKMRVDASYDPMWENSPINLVSIDEVSSRPATADEKYRLGLPADTSVVSIAEAITDTENNLLMIQEIVLSPRVRLTFKFPFVNRPS